MAMSSSDAPIADRWTSTVRRDYEDLGLLFEKYDVEHQTPGRGGEYPVQMGFGWTNGVTRAFLADPVLAGSVRVTDDAV